MTRFTLPILGLLLVFSTAVSAGSGAFLGVYIQPLDEIEGLDYQGTGVYVKGPVEDSGAEKAGIEAGDVLIEIQGEKLAGSGHLRDILDQYSPGDKVSVKVWRNGETKTFDVELGEQKGMKIDKVIKKVMVDHSPNVWLGVKLQDLEDQLAEYFDVEHGALITEVFDDSPAEKAGLKAGDVIIKARGEDVEDASEFQEMIGEGEAGDKVELVFVRSGKEMKKEVELAEVPEDMKKNFFGPVKWFGKGLEEPFLFNDDDFKDIDVRVFTDSDDFMELKQEMKQLKEEMLKLKQEIKEMK